LHRNPQQQSPVLSHDSGLLHEVQFFEVTLNPHPVGHELQSLPEKLLHGSHFPFRQPYPLQHGFSGQSPISGLVH
jgi:hypothetical protein